YPGNSSAIRADTSASFRSAAASAARRAGMAAWLRSLGGLVTAAVNFLSASCQPSSASCCSRTNRASAALLGSKRRAICASAAPVAAEARMRGAERALANGEAALEQRLGFGIAALGIAKRCQGMQAAREIGMARREGFLADRDAAQKERLGLGIAALIPEYVG